MTIYQKGIKLGRGPDCDIVIDDPYVSREHLWVGPDENGVLVVRDLRSTNGTILNGTNIQQQTLRPGDTVQIGNSEKFRFQYHG